MATVCGYGGGQPPRLGFMGSERRSYVRQRAPEEAGRSLIQLGQRRGKRGGCYVERTDSREEDGADFRGELTRWPHAAVAE
jgi:hypothetical protein